MYTNNMFACIYNYFETDGDVCLPFAHSGHSPPLVGGIGKHLLGESLLPTDENDIIMSPQHANKSGGRLVKDLTSF